MVLSDFKKRGRGTIGGKAEGLLHLKELKLDVPDFCVIPAETFDELFSVENGATLRRERLLAFQFADEDIIMLHSLVSAWGFPEIPLVVRSSVADEDGTSDAFAGLMDTFMNLKAFDSVLRAINSCAASAYSERALSYRKQKGLSLSPRPAVVIQRQVHADASGVIFSTFPDYPQELAIHAVIGFGEGLVGGKLEPDEFYIDKRTGILSREKIVRKTHSFRASCKEGLEETELSQEVGDAPSLRAGQVEQLFQIASLLERELGRPQDVEFVMSNGTPFIVQTRSITAPIPPVVVYDNSNIQESYCGVTTPLTFSFAKRAYATVYRQTMNVLGLPEGVIRDNEEVVANLLGLVKGRIYYNINNWYRGLQLLPSFKQNKEDMERMMGLEEPVDFIEDKEKSFLEKLRLLPQLLNLIRLVAAFRKLDKSVIKFRNNFAAWYSHFYDQKFEELDYKELIAQRKALDKNVLEKWSTPIINDFYVMMMNGRVRRSLLGLGINDPEQFLSRLYSGSQQVESIQPILEMQRLARMVIADSELRKLVEESPEASFETIPRCFPEFYKEVLTFLDKYGDRTAGELKLETRTMRTDPLLFYRLLKNQIESEGLGFGSEFRDGAVAELEQKLAGRSPFFRSKVLSNLEKLKRSIQFRESMRLERTRLFGMYRHLYLLLGEMLAEEGVISNKRDIFYLTEEEICEGTSSDNRLRMPGLIENRKQEFEGYQSEDIPSRVIVPSAPVTNTVKQGHDINLLQGTGCTPGQLIGEVIVVKNTDLDFDPRGKIVCALRTDPGWAVIFPSCAGVLIEKGSSLSHSVILLRELQIPAIINIPGLTTILKTGMTVRMNSSTGLIEILENGD
ncbi:PEP/pyruvate-binding domain-containing protein [Pedobacter sp. SYSU D00535]|uniref:PEP/pyruvate-binding domain-containing protein n=1 Tax=Pedobacter sp. SYSU D00535 TaxID=2810308 RepID=UPI001A97A579|nr:PEP/pyruvate-binding domain-containing protein [Pedobacter sp. SYSU D00535]